MRHELKTWPEQFEAVVNGSKRHEVRINDRNFAVGDELVLRAWNPASETYTGDSCMVRVSYITAGGTFGLPENLCVMSIKTAFNPGAAWPFPDRSRV